MALVGTASVLKNAKRCSERDGTGGGGSSVPEGAVRRIKEIIKCSFQAEQNYLKDEKEITNVVTPSKGEDVSVEGHTGPVPCKQIKGLYFWVLVGEAGEPHEVFPWSQVIVRKFGGPRRPNPSKTI